MIRVETTLEEAILLLLEVGSLGLERPEQLIGPVHF